ncbi:tetratricopeptide repeat protein [Christiangramia sabulilitoris]|uniref:Tetratricopeptide repeat protein n=1 Tax=Christiangramia sabulilitoris TaxID=2583991 RepID=A0A550I720_9FLAO|nr:tetratricopeptide repeat protein [Christiangramia sabulilitoris]TRO66774.1 tetratricopeptide repeat protein [Christiangramia sabulilitoris]
MRRTLNFIFFLIIFSSCDNNSASKEDLQKALELSNTASEFLMNGEISKAEEFYSQASKLDPESIDYKYALIGIFIRREEFDKAHETLESLPKTTKGTPYYFQTKGFILEKEGKLQKAQLNYKQAYKLSDSVEVREEADLMPLVNFSMLETLAGEKDKAVNRINKVLQYNFLTRSNKEYLETFRNEFEYYSGKGNSDFEQKRDLTLCTKNIDSIEKVLKQRHINISGTSQTNEKYDKIYISNKFEKGLKNLKSKICE